MITEDLLMSTIDGIEYINTSIRLIYEELGSRQTPLSQDIKDRILGVSRVYEEDLKCFCSNIDEINPEIKKNVRQLTDLSRASEGTSKTVRFAQSREERSTQSFQTESKSRARKRESSPVSHRKKQERDPSIAIT